MTKEKIRVLVADDSALMRKLISDIINGDERMEVIATARNGEDAYNKVLDLKPDVVTMDVEMPVQDGIATLEKLMLTHPVAVIMLSAQTQSGSEATIKALEKGAVDFVAKTGGSISVDIEKVRLELLDKIKTAAEIPLDKIRHTRIKTTFLPPSLPPRMPIIKTEKLSSVNRRFVLVAIGTSTGGPKALYEVLSRLPEGLDAAILIVQHMPANFTPSLAKRLNSISKFNVKEAEQGEEVKAGNAYLAPGDCHMQVNENNNRLVIILNKNPLVNGHRPSVDVMFNSAAKTNYAKIGVLMTGMGSDGAQGMKALKEAGAVNIGESAETCIVYGMPRSAVQLGVVDYEIPLDMIANTIVQAMNKF